MKETGLCYNIMAIKKNPTENDWSHMAVLEPDDTLPDTYYLKMTKTEGTYVLYFTSEEPPSDEDGNPVTLDKAKEFVEKYTLKSCEVTCYKPASSGTDISRVTIEPIGNQVYTGQAVTPSITVKDNAVTLQQGTDYYLNYKDNTAVGTATVEIIGTGKYFGTKTETFQIVKSDAEAMVTANGTENPTVSYGDQIRFTFHAQPKKTGGNRKNYALQPNEVAFYCGKELEKPESIHRMRLFWFIAPQTAKFQSENLPLRQSLGAATHSMPDEDR